MKFAHLSLPRAPSAMLFSVPLSFCFCLVGCSTPSFNEETTEPDSGAATEAVKQAAPGNSPNISNKGKALWEAFLQDEKSTSLQPACSSRKIEIPAGTPYKGSVLLYHGFTACPQQFFDWAQVLAKQGFAVYLPLIPGHGRVRPAPGRDNFQDMPNENDYWSKLSGFTDRMNNILRETNGIRVVGGLSQGGALATWSAYSGKDLYKRALIMTPLFQLSNTFAKLIMSTASNLQKLRLPAPKELLNRDAGWGPGCEDEMSRKPPRNGICTFQLRHAFAASQFGWDTLEKIGQSNIQVQGVGVMSDPVVDNDPFRTAITKLAYGKKGLFSQNVAKLMNNESPNARMCFYPGGDKKFMAKNIGKFNQATGANHSLFSKFDTPDENKWWLRSLTQNATAFVANGTFFPSQELVKNADSPQCL